MTTQKQLQTFKEAIAWCISALLFLCLAVITTSCGKKDGKNATTPTTTTTYDPNCPTCFTGGTVLGSAIGFHGGTGSNYSILLEVTLTGSGATTTGTGTTNNYSGSVSAVGAMTVKVSSPYCPLPVGTYQVATSAVGQWDASLGGVRNLSLTATHTDGTVAKMRMIYGILYGVQPYLQDESGHSFPNGLMSDVVVDQVNTTNCVVGYPGLPPLNQYFFTF